MTPILIAVLLALAPEPKLSATDDFNEVVALNEGIMHCEAVEMFRTEPDEIRLVRFDCARGSILIPFLLKGEEGWFHAQRQWQAVPKRAATGKEI